jgi:hypothetical protein
MATKKQLREKYLEWVKNNYSKPYERNKDIFKEMKQLAKENNLPIWCMTQLLEELLKVDNSSIRGKAFELYNEYRMNEGRIEAFQEFALSTDNFKI